MRSTQVKDIFDQARRLAPGEQESYVRERCAGDTAMASEVAALLRDLEAAGAFLNAGTHRGDGGAVTEVARLSEGPGSIIGRYSLLQLIGEGGFGSIFLAEQREPVRRTVALKIIKLGMDTRQVIARFEQERQALALMDHPSIARVLDAGATETGRPYFVMELVRGEAITEYSDAHKLGMRDRLEVFVQVCHAVQHAHQKGIIHRDLKPSNILVTIAGDKPVPKIIDFGIAKATGQRLTDKTFFTEQRILIGTPQYMSPEQADMGGVDIDTRSDIYSLGVLLYELLTGVTPFDPERLRSASWADLQRIIRDEEPPRPSTRVSTKTVALSEIAVKRDIQPGRLRGLIRGDLDWIVMKCLEKGRARRYQTASALALDIERHLVGDPVMAAPPSTLYRVGKFLRRRRVPVLAGAAAGAVLVTATVVSTSMWMRARDAETKSTEELWKSLIGEARARRGALDMGRRFDSLDIIRRATAIRPSLEVRNEAIATLALTDLKRTASTPSLAITAPFGVSPTGDWMLVGSGDSTEIRRTSDYALLGIVPSKPVKQSWVHGPSMSADGRRVAFPSSDEKGGVVVQVWDLPETVKVRQVQADGDQALSQDGRLLAVVRKHASDPPDAQHPHAVQLFDVATGNKLWEAPALPDAYVAFRPGHAQLTVGSAKLNSGLELLNTGTGTIEGLVATPASAAWFAWDQAGDRLAVGSPHDCWIAVNERGTLDSWITLQGHQAFVPELSFGPGGEFLLSGSWDSTARLWDLFTEQCILIAPTDFYWPARSEHLLMRMEEVEPGVRRFHRFEFTRPASFRRAAPASLGLSQQVLESVCIGSHPARPLLAVGSANTPALTWWTASAGRIVGTSEIGPVNDIAFSPGGEFLYTIGGRGLEQRPLLMNDDVLSVGPPTILDPGGYKSFAVSTSGRFAVIVPDWPTTGAYMIDLASGERTRATSLPMAVAGVRLSPDDRYAAFATWHRADVAVWDLRDGTVQTLGIKAPANCQFSPDGRFLIASLWGGDRVYQTGSWRLVATLESPDALHHPTWTACSPDARLYARIVDSRRIRLFDLNTFAEVATLESPEPFGISALLFGRDSRELIALTNRANVLYVWDLAKLRTELRELGLDWSDQPIPHTPPARSDIPVVRKVLQMP